MPTPHEAQAALAEAARQADRLRRTDDRFRLVLLVIAAVYAAIGIIVGFTPAEQPWVTARLGVPLLLLGALVGCPILLLGMRATSRSGSAWFNWSVAAFSIWNGIVVAVSTATGWWGGGQHAGLPGLHFTASAMVAAVPLVVAAWLMGSRRR